MCAEREREKWERGGEEEVTDNMREEMKQQR